MQLRQSLAYKRGETKAKLILSHILVRATVERREEQGRGREGRRRRRRRSPKIRYVFALESWVIGFLRFGMEISCSFGLGFVQRSHKPLNCWGYESRTPIGGK